MDDKPRDSTTPEEDEILQELRGGLRVWLQDAAGRSVPHDLCLMALMLFTTSGVASAKVPKERFLAAMGRYYDIYETNLRTRS
jgi:hypothetical protein